LKKTNGPGEPATGQGAASFQLKNSGLLFQRAQIHRKCRAGRENKRGARQHPAFEILQAPRKQRPPFGRHYTRFAGEAPGSIVNKRDASAPSQPTGNQHRIVERVNDIIFLLPDRQPGRFAQPACANTFPGMLNQQIYIGMRGQVYRRSHNIDMVAGISQRLQHGRRPRIRAAQRHPGICDE
jgi:hypothetical protein